MKNLKQGVKSSEFYVALAGVVALVWQQVQVRCQFDQTFVIATAGVVISYIAGRSYLKGKK